LAQRAVLVLPRRLVHQRLQERALQPVLARQLVLGLLPRQELVLRLALVRQVRLVPGLSQPLVMLQALVRRLRLVLDFQRDNLPVLLRVLARRPVSVLQLPRLLALQRA
jgi:hypothetical protein